MKRRQFIALLGGAAAPWWHAACAQPDRLRRIGVLMPGAESDPESQADITAFQQELERAGWAERRNVRIDYRWSGGKADVARAATVELLSLAPDVIVTDGRQALEELRHAALAVPIIFMEINEPVFFGFDQMAEKPQQIRASSGSLAL